MNKLNLHMRSSLTLRLSWLLLAMLLFTGPATAQVVKILTPTDGAVSYRDRIGVIARGQPNRAMTLWMNGEEKMTTGVRADMSADFLNLTAQTGPNLIKVVQTLPNGMVWADSITLHVGGPAAQIFMTVDPPTLPADSTSQAYAVIEVLDQWGIPLEDGRMVTVSLSEGTLLGEDAYPSQTGMQRQIRDGRVDLDLVSGSRITTARLVAESDGVSQELEIAYTQPHERWSFTGTAIGQIGLRTNKAAPAGVNADDAFSSGLYSEGKAAFFGRGSIGGDFLLTTSYDSDRRFDHQVFRFLTPDRFFPIHGDASSIYYESPTTSRFYAKLSHNRSYIQFGDFSTGSINRELIAYNRAFTGVSTMYKEKRAEIQVFGTSTDQSIKVDQIPGEGVSGLYYMSAGQAGIPIVEGTERVYIQVRDRLHPENVLKQDAKYRFTDYDIDYDGGTLLFKQPVPFRTPDENPVIILVTYETTQAVDKFLIGGGRVALTPHDDFSVGATVIGEEQANRNFWLTGVDTEWRPVAKMTLATELARTSEELVSQSSPGAAPDGYAWKVGARGNVTSSVGYELYYREADLNFRNPSSATARPGLRKVRGRATWSPWKGMSIIGESFVETDRLNSQDRLSSKVGSQFKYKSFSNQILLEGTKVDRPTGISETAILTAGSQWQANRWLFFGGRREQSFGDEDISYRPTLNAINTKLAFNDRIQLVGEHKFRDGSFIDSSFTAVGLQSQVGGGLQAYANYELDDGLNGYRNMAIIGLRHNFQVVDNLTLNTGVERIKTIRGNTQGDFTAFSVAGEYLPPKAIKASGRFEHRNGVSLDKSVASIAFDFTLGNGFSWLAKHTYLDEVRGAGLNVGGGVAEQERHHLLTGLAYRPLSNDYLNVLGKYEFKYDRSTVLNPSATQYTHIGSIEGILEPKSQIELFLRYGFKVNYLDSEGFSSRSLTDLWMTNVRYEWYRRLDVLGEYRLLHSHTARDFRHGASGEIGVIPQPNTRVAFGYNFVGFVDRDFSGSNYWAHGPFLKFQLKFTENAVAGWLNGLQSFMK